MAIIIFKTFVVLGLLSLPASGLNPTVSHPIIIQGRPGKQGPPGKSGEAGLPGVQGPPGSPGVVDYDKIFKKVDKKTRKGLQDMDSKFENLQRKCTKFEKRFEKMNSKVDILQDNYGVLAEGFEEVNSKLTILQSNTDRLETGFEKMASKVDILQDNTTVLAEGLEEMSMKSKKLESDTTLLAAGLERLNQKISTIPWDLLNRVLRGQRCKEGNGLAYDGKCFFVPSSSSRLNYNQAFQKCRSQNSLIAELHSVAHQKTIQDFFRSRTLTIGSLTYLWLGMTYQSSERNLRFRSGKEVSVDQFKWHQSFTKYPSGSDDKISIVINNDGNERGEGIMNVPANYNKEGVICEKPL